MTRVYTLAIAIAFFLTSCATQLQPVVGSAKSEKHQVTKTYSIGEVRSVNVGDPLIKLQDYWVETTETPVMVPDGPITLDGGPVHVFLNAGQKYPIHGRYTLDGIDYIAVQISANHAVLVKPDGSLHNRVIATSPGMNGYVTVVYTMTLSDSSVRMTRDTKEEVKTTKGYENFEILYTGITGAALNLTYREFSPDGLARVAFFQNLTYESTAKTITFKKYRIAIDKATSEAITYRVLEDGR
jgi:hypothetical protein